MGQLMILVLALMVSGFGQTKPPVIQLPYSENLRAQYNHDWGWGLNWCHSQNWSKASYATITQPDSGRKQNMPCTTLQYIEAENAWKRCHFRG